RRTVRPLRLACLVPVSDGDAVVRAIQLSTCIWGGAQTSLIPVYDRKPPRWQHLEPWPGARGYASGLLDGFEPDYFVEMVPGIGQKLGLDSARVLDDKDVLNPGRVSHVEYGLSVATALFAAYDDDLKYVRKHKLKALWAPESANTLLSGLLLGAYPSD